jgi:hypothetical protein
MSVVKWGPGGRSSSGGSVCSLIHAAKAAASTKQSFWFPLDDSGLPEREANSRSRSWWQLGRHGWLRGQGAP